MSEGTFTDFAAQMSLAKISAFSPYFNGNVLVYIVLDKRAAQTNMFFLIPP